MADKIYFEESISRLFLLNHIFTSIVDHMVTSILSASKLKYDS
jgi:hypothetical protein